MKNRNYEGALNKLHSLGVFGIKPGLERIKILLKKIGNPEQQIKCIHITGTNGKGSVSTMLEGMLVASGYKVGKFTSPHLVSYNERMVVQKQQIADREFADLVYEICHCATDMTKDMQPTQFEVLTAMAFLYFARQKVDLAIIEVGMGGLLDSTNVITPICSIITNVSLDHMDKCGDSIEKIAVHKAGIIKKNIPVITAATAEALDIIRETASKYQAPLYIAGKDFYCQEISKSLLGQKIKYFAGKEAVEFEIKLLGKHQLTNSAVAITAFKLITKGQKMQAIASGLKETIWSGRAEIISQDPVIILDGAHNPAGAIALRELLDDELLRAKRKCFILGFMQDKLIIEIVNILCKKEDTIIVVNAAPDLSRAASPEQLKQLIQAPTILMHDYQQAILKAKEVVGKEGLVCIAGSLYLVGNIKKTLLQ